MQLKKHDNTHTCKTKASKDSPFLDLWKFCAIFLMIVYHFTYDLNLLGLQNIDMYSFFWFWLPRLIVFMFLFASGTAFAMNRKAEYTKKFFFRWGQIAASALAISIVTSVIFPKSWVYFGILHCVAVCLLLAPIFSRHRWLGYIILTAFAFTWWAFEMSFRNLSSPLSIRSIDYIPLYPWLAAFLLGIYFGPNIFLAFDRVFNLSVAAFIKKTARSSLSIYLIHQPLIFAGMHLYIFLRDIL